MNPIIANMNQIIMMIIVGSAFKRIDRFCVAIHVTDHFIWHVLELKKCHTVNGTVLSVVNVRIPNAPIVRRRVRMKD